MSKWAILIAVVLGVVVTDSVASKRILPIESSDVSTYTPSDTTVGKYYKLTCTVPGDLQARHLERAVLELRVEVDTLSRDGYLDDTPLLEVYALKNGFTGAVDFTKFETPSTAIKPVSVGDDRRVLLDVTPIIKLYIAEPSRNQSLIVGSLSGDRPGDFTLKTGAFPDGSVARIHLYLAPKR